MSITFSFDMVGCGYTLIESQSFMSGYNNHTKPILCWVKDGVMCYEMHLTQNKSALISFDDLDLLCQYNWYADRTSHGYRSKSTHKNNNKKTHLYMHRVVVGDCGDMICDHIRDEFPDSFEVDNRRCNLRKVTQSQNQHNRILNRNACVHWNEERGRYQVIVGCGGIKPYQPTFNIKDHNNDKKEAKRYADLCHSIFRKILHGGISFDSPELFVGLTHDERSEMISCTTKLKNKMNTGAQQ